MTQEKTPALLGADTGGICERLSHHCTAHQQKNVQVHHQGGAIIGTKAKAPVLENTFVLRSKRSDNALLSCPNSVTGLWADGPFREAGRTASTSVFNICPPTALENAEVDSKTCTRSMTMPEGTPTGASAQNTTTSPDHHALSFVKVEFKGPRKQRLTDWFAVPDESYCDGNIRGYRVAAELMAWVQTNPADYGTGLVVREVMAEASAVLAQPHTPYGTPDRRGAAVGFLDAMAQCIQFVAHNSNHQAYFAGKAQQSETWAKESALRDAERNRETGRRLAAARKAKREARMAGSEVLA